MDGSHRSGHPWSGCRPIARRTNISPQTDQAKEMKLRRQEIVDLLRENGDTGTAHQAEANLPQHIDIETDRDLLAEHGIDVESLLSDIDP